MSSSAPCSKCSNGSVLVSGSGLQTFSQHLPAQPYFLALTDFLQFSVHGWGPVSSDSSSPSFWAASHSPESLGIDTTASKKPPQSPLPYVSMAHSACSAHRALGITGSLERFSFIFNFYFTSVRLQHRMTTFTVGSWHMYVTQINSFFTTFPSSLVIFPLSIGPLPFCKTSVSMFPIIFYSIL